MGASGRLDRDQRRGRVVAVAAAAILAAGLVAQSLFFVRETVDQVTASGNHPLRTFLERVDSVLPANASFAAPSSRVSDAGRYILYPRPRLMPVYTKSGLQQSGVQYVIVTPGHRPPALVGQHRWYTTVLTTPQGRVLKVLDG